MIQVSFLWPCWPFGYLQARMHQIKKIKMDSWKENYFLTGETQDHTHFRSIGKMIWLTAQFSGKDHLMQKTLLPLISMFYFVITFRVNDIISFAPTPIVLELVLHLYYNPTYSLPWFSHTLDKGPFLSLNIVYFCCVQRISSLWTCSSWDH